MGICAYEAAIVLDDDKLPVPPKSTTAVDHMPISSGVYRLSQPATDIDAFVRYRDMNDTLSAAVSDSVAIAPLTWIVGGEATLVIDSVYTDTETMSLGQSGVEVNISVSNSGAADVLVDSLRITFDGQLNHPVFWKSSSARNRTARLFKEPTLNQQSGAAALHKIGARFY